MTEGIITQLGLTLVYSAVGLLIALTERVERSPAMRLLSVGFFLFAIDAALSVVDASFDVPVAHGLAWAALATGGALTVAGTLRFIGRPLPRALYVAMALLAAVAIFPPLIGVTSQVSRVVVFAGVSVSMFWAARLIFQAGVPTGVGRWVATTAFMAAGLYAALWSIAFESSFLQRFEFFLDISVVFWGATGVLLMHFERSREQLRRLAQEQLELRTQLERSERLEALGRLASGVAHDFNNVLTTVINGSEFALHNLDSRRQAAEQLQVVLETAKGAAGFTRQLLTLGRRRLPAAVPVSFRDAIEGALRVTRPSLRAGIEVVRDLGDEPIVIAAGEGQAEQLAINLVRNAAEAMPEGGTITVRLRRSTQDGQLGLLSVEDTGVGMDDDTLAHVFEPFYSTKTHRGGTGLGLATVYAIAQQLGGDVSVESVPQRGSTFTIRLPIASFPPVTLEGSAPQTTRS